MNSSTSFPMGGSQKNIGRGKDDAITNPIRQKPSRHNGLQRKRQQKIPAPKSKENDAITNSLLKCKKQTIHKAARSPTHYLHSQEDESFARRCDHLPAIPKRKWQRHLHKNQRVKVAGNTHTKTGGELLHQPNPKRGGYGLLTFTNCFLFCKMHSLYCVKCTHLFFFV